MARIIKQQTQFRNQNIGLVRFQNLQTPKTQAILNAVDKGNQILLREVDKDMQKQTDKMIGEYTISQLTAMDDETGAPELLNFKYLTGMGANQRERHTALIKQNHANAIEQDIKYRVGILKRKYKTMPNGADEFVKATQNFAETYINELGNAQGEYRTFIENAAIRSIQDNELILREQRAITEFNNSQAVLSNNITNDIIQGQNLSVLTNESGDITPFQQTKDFFKNLKTERLSLFANEDQRIKEEQKIDFGYAIAIHQRLKMEGVLSFEQLNSYQKYLEGRVNINQLVNEIPEFKEEFTELAIHSDIRDRSGLGQDLRVSVGSSSLTKKQIQIEEIGKSLNKTNSLGERLNTVSQQLKDDKNFAINLNSHQPDLRTGLTNEERKNLSEQIVNDVGLSQNNRNTIIDIINNPNLFDDPEKKAMAVQVLSEVDQITNAPDIAFGEQIFVNNIFSPERNFKLSENEEENKFYKTKLQTLLAVLNIENALGDPEKTYKVMQNLDRRVGKSNIGVFNKEFEKLSDGLTIEDFIKNQIDDNNNLDDATRYFKPILNYLSTYYLKGDDTELQNITVKDLEKFVDQRYKQTFLAPHPFQIGMSGELPNKKNRSKILGSLNSLPNKQRLKALEKMQLDLSTRAIEANGKKYILNGPLGENFERAYIYTFASFNKEPTFILVDEDLEPIYMSDDAGEGDSVGLMQPISYLMSEFRTNDGKDLMIDIEDEFKILMSKEEVLEERKETATGRSKGAFRTFDNPNQTDVEAVQDFEKNTSMISPLMIDDAEDTMEKLGIDVDEYKKSREQRQKEFDEEVKRIEEGIEQLLRGSRRGAAR
tara:strand:+ start:149 stop:2629 length:2481 start_codon:yes stop_codon:yes gene_type:complete